MLKSRIYEICCQKTKIFQTRNFQKIKIFKNPDLKTKFSKIFKKPNFQKPKFKKKEIFKNPNFFNKPSFSKVKIQHKNNLLKIKF